MAEIKFLDQFGKPFTLGWLDEVVDFNVSGPFFVEIHGTISNDNLPGSSGLPTPQGVVTALGSAHMIWSLHEYTPGPNTISLSFDYLLRVQNDAIHPAASFVWSGINPKPHGVMGVTVDFYTTGDAAGTKNITQEQASKIKKASDLTAIGLSPDKETGGSWNQVGPGTYLFTFYRVPTTPLTAGTHIKATAPIPSV